MGGGAGAGSLLRGQQLELMPTQHSGLLYGADGDADLYDEEQATIPAKVCGLLRKQSPDCDCCFLSQ